MKKFLNFRFFRRAASFVVYALLMAMLISDMYSNSGANSEMSHQHYLTWWTLFLVLDIWFFGNNDFKSNASND